MNIKCWNAWQLRIFAIRLKSWVSFYPDSENNLLPSISIQNYNCNLCFTPGPAGPSQANQDRSNEKERKSVWRQFYSTSDNRLAATPLQNCQWCQNGLLVNLSILHLENLFAPSFQVHLCHNYNNHNYNNVLSERSRSSLLSSWKLISWSLCKGQEFHINHQFYSFLQSTAYALATIKTWDFGKKSTFCL